jgi:hypothetical protein
VARAGRWIVVGVLGYFTIPLILSGAGALIATFVGFWSDLRSPWNYTFAYGVAALTLGGLLAYLRRYGAQLPPPWGRGYQSVTGGLIGVSETTAVIQAVVTTPGEDTAIVKFDLLREMNQRVPTTRRVKAIQFLRPTNKLIKARELPEAIRWRFRTIAVVKSFTDDAVILDSFLRSEDARIQVWYADDAIKPPEPPSAPESEPERGGPTS